MYKNIKEFIVLSSSDALGHHINAFKSCLNDGIFKGIVHPKNYK